jgi:hypothetical protein
MAGLDPAIHVFRAISKKDVDARHKAGHDGSGWLAAFARHCHGMSRQFKPKSLRHSASGPLFEHDLYRKTGTRFSGSC